MAEHVWSIASQRSIIDIHDNSLSIIDVIEELTLESPNEIPENGVLIPFPFVITSMWVRSDLATPEQLQSRVVIRSPAGKDLASSKENLLDLTEHERMRTRAMMESLPITGEGTHTVLVQQLKETKSGERWTTEAKIPISIHFRKTTE